MGVDIITCTNNVEDGQQARRRTRHVLKSTGHSYAEEKGQIREEPRRTLDSNGSGDILRVEVARTGDGRAREARRCE
jgi:hypothetical protein